MLCILGVDVDVVDDHIRTRHPLPLFPPIEGLIQTFSGAGIDGIGVGWIEHQNARPSRGHGNALNLVVKLASAVAAIDPGTGAGVDHVGGSGIDDDREHIGVVDQPLLDVVPIGAAVGGLPGQVRRSGVERARVSGIEGQSGDVLHLHVGFRRDSIPRRARVDGQKNALRCTGRDYVRIGGRNGERFDPRTARSSQNAPMVAAVRALPHARVWGISRIQTSIKMSGFGGMNQNRIKYARCPTWKRQQPPGRTGVVRTEQQRVARTGDQRSAIARVNCYCSRAPSKRTGQLPGADSRKRGNQ